MGGGINYSFHYPLTKDIRLAVGLGAIVDNIKIDLGGIYFGIDPNDPSRPIDPNSDRIYQRLVNTGSAHTTLNIRLGILVYSPKFYFGFSYLPLVNVVLQDNETGVSYSYYRGVIQAGYSFPLSATMDIKPSVLALWQDDNQFIIDYNVKLYIEEKIWFGLITYRDVKSMVGLVGFNYNEMLGASYSYELAGSDMRQFSDGSHELVLSICLKNFKRQKQQTNMVRTLSFDHLRISSYRLGSGMGFRNPTQNFPLRLIVSTEDILPMQSPDGKTLFFARAASPDNVGGKFAGTDIYIRTYDESTSQNWTKPQNEKTFNDKGTNALIGINDKGDEVFLLQTTGTKRALGVYQSAKRNNTWTEPKLISIPGLSTEDFLGANVSPDMKVIIFSMNGEESRGNEDLYISLKSAKGEWSKPESCINH